MRAAFLITLQTMVFVIETAAWLLCAPIHILTVFAENLLDNIGAAPFNHHIPHPIVTTNEQTAIQPSPVVGHSEPPVTTDAFSDNPRPVPYICHPDIVSSWFYAVFVGRQIGVFEDWWAFLGGLCILTMLMTASVHMQQNKSFMSRAVL
jgi:hypothetical protein